MTMLDGVKACDSADSVPTRCAPDAPSTSHLTASRSNTSVDAIVPSYPNLTDPQRDIQPYDKSALPAIVAYERQSAVSTVSPVAADSSGKTILL
jgi:hypothetical protein